LTPFKEIYHTISKYKIEKRVDLFSKFNKQIDTIFLDTQSANFKTDNKVNIIISPSLYWVKKVKLPVKRVRDAMPLLESIFEDILPDGIYSYSTYKVSDEFFIFAYQDKQILDILSNKGIETTQINNIHFAQSELSHIKGAIKINETQSIYVKDDIVVLLPCCWIKENGDLDIGELTLSKHHINLKQYGHIVDEKSLYSIIGLLFIFTLLISFEYIMILNSIGKISNEKDEIFTTYSLKPTMMQNKSMLKEYKYKHTKQTNLRKYISNVLSLNLKNDVKLTLLNSNHKKLTVLFSGVDEKSFESIKQQLRNKNIQNSSKLKSKTLSLEFKL